MKNCILLLASLFIAFSGSAQRYGVPNFKIVSDFTDKAFVKNIDGIAIDKRGYLYVPNFQQEGTIGIVDYFGKVSSFVTLPEGGVASGLTVDTIANTLYIADYIGKNIYKCDLNTKVLTLFVHNNSFSSLKDILLTSNGNLYVTDQDNTIGTGSIWLVKPDGQVTMLESSLGLTKGIAINNQQDILYVTEEIQRSEQKLRNLLSFEIDSKGFLSNKTRFSTFFDFSLAGIQVDKFGNIYISRSEKGVITILNPEGKVIREITLLGKNPSAITFGGIDKKTVFVTVNDSLTVQSFRMPLLGQK
ncbi:MAG: hypothetical protein RLZZ175_2002 [Bacteroidota bacterium]|jgi:gluconolactonase